MTSMRLVPSMMPHAMDVSEPATGILGSTLLSASKTNANRVLPYLSSGCTGIDEEALSGGFNYGEITSIAGSNGTGKTTVSFLVPCAT